MCAPVYVCIQGSGQLERFGTLRFLREGNVNQSHAVTKERRACRARKSPLCISLLINHRIHYCRITVKQEYTAVLSIVFIQTGVH